MSLIVIIPTSSLLFTTGSLSNFISLILFIVSLTVASDFIVAIFFGEISIAFIFLRSSFGLFIKAQRMSLRDMNPRRFFFAPIITRLPTFFLTIIFAHSRRLVSGFIVAGLRVIMSET